MSNQVKFYASTQTGAPQLTGQAGSLIAVLNACLLNGFNPRAISSITRDGDVATATVDAGHGYADHDIVEISGVSQSEYNGDFRIFNCSTNTFQFTVENAPTTPATGTITVKIAPLNWASPFTGINKAVYRSKNVESNRLFLSVDETSIAGGTAVNGYLTASATVRMYENMTDVDTGTGVSSVFWRKSLTDDATSRVWFLVGDEKRFWVIIQPVTSLYVNNFFGDILSFKAGDAYNTLLCGHSQLGQASSAYLSSFFSADVSFSVDYSSSANYGIFIARSHTQLGGAAQAFFTNGSLSSQSNFGNTSLSYPNGADNGFHTMPVMSVDKDVKSIRGMVPGLFCPLQQFAFSSGHSTRVGDIPISGSSRRVLICRGTTDATRIVFDITGPWE